MGDGMTTDEETILAVGAAAPGVSDYRMSGYCAGCGTWDAHGMTCTSCGYAFAPEADEIDRD